MYVVSQVTRAVCLTYLIWNWKLFPFEMDFKSFFLKWNYNFGAGFFTGLVGI